MPRYRPPDHLPAHILARPDFITACDARDLGTIFRIIKKWAGPGFTASHLSRRCELTVSRVTDYTSGRMQAQSLDIFTRVSDGLHIPGSMLGLEHRPWEQTTDVGPAASKPDHVQGTRLLASKPTRVRIAAEEVPPGDVPHTTETDEMNRRELLRALSVAGALVSIPSHGALENKYPRAVDTTDISEYELMNSHLWKTFSLSKSKRAVYPLVRQQLDLLTASLQRSHTSQTKKQLCALTSDIFQLAGEIFFDSSRYTDAAHCYTLAASAGKEANAYDLWACALTRHAFIGIYDHSFTETAPMLAAASQIAQRGDSRLSTRYWVAAVQAELFAGLGDLDGCDRALGTAEAVHGLSGQVHNGGWLRFDGSRLAEQRGTCYARLGRYDLAETALTDALTKSLSLRRRGSVLTDLALLSMQRGEIDRVLKYGDTALELFLNTNSGYLGRKLQELQLQLAPMASDNRVANFTDHISELTALHGGSERKRGV